MKRTLLALFAVSTLGALEEARADVVSDRVFLTTGTGSCGTNASGFRRVKQNPDGSQVAETVEFQVPYGSYLEITNIEYTTPYWTAWAKYFSQSIDFTIRQRSGTASTVVHSAVYNNRFVYAEDENEAYVSVNEVVSSGANAHVVAYPVGPLMSSAARLCVATNNNFYVYGGSIRVRGRLIASGEPLLQPAPGTVLK